MVAFDVDSALRWARFDPRRTLTRRREEELPFASTEDFAGPPLLLDTSVYIHQLQGVAPTIVEQLVDLRHVTHSSVAIQEMTHTLGALNPDDPRSAVVVSGVRTMLGAMPDHRIFTPDIDVLGRAALLAGMLCRLQGYSRDTRLKALFDATLFLQAHKHGFTILTANIVEFDFLLQLIPAGRVLFYRTAPRGS